MKKTKSKINKLFRKYGLLEPIRKDNSHFDTIKQNLSFYLNLSEEYDYKDYNMFVSPSYMRIDLEELGNERNFYDKFRMTIESRVKFINFDIDEITNVYFYIGTRNEILKLLRHLIEEEFLDKDRNPNKTGWFIKHKLKKYEKRNK